MLTLEGWIEIMYFLFEAVATPSYTVWMFFYSGTFLLAFFVSQIALAGNSIFFFVRW
jgi:hypothetical protein